MTFSKFIIGTVCLFSLIEKLITHPLLMNVACRQQNAYNNFVYLTVSVLSCFFNLYSVSSYNGLKPNATGRQVQSRAC
uniref:Putative secreted protein n=1 Tax=Ixodes ricinus TaxID=34613 RepID=A0A6B0UCC6_IXORI